MVRFLCLRGLCALFRGRLLPEFQSGGAAAQCGAAVRGRLPGAPARRLAVRLAGRPSRAARRPDAVGHADVLRLADDRGDADLCVDRDLCAHPAGRCAHHPGPEPRRRIRHQRHLSHRDGRPPPSRLLFQLPIRHADRRADLRAARAAPAAEGVSDARARSAPGAGASPSSSGRCSPSSRSSCGAICTRPRPSRRPRRRW